ncbi:Xaa-Pro peptidase family protein [Labrenzia sp. PHM005]|uniref:M24 family metallopeptidase n=1 Tax=Labrenzia sp. PHM005 TaxID=2590016 RepID=UPI0011403D64|nr:Xaa-Pro peptidase family protein [Labrenzia sp. PHM005]QDG75548.1 aminopeptidase P family protein [Labrenzia sp. PHM005]
MSEADFPEQEFEDRTERAQRLMHAQKLDALLFTTEAEVRYFTGFRTLFWQSPARPWFCVLPKSGKPFAVIPQIGAHLMASTWLDDIRTFAAPHPTDEGVSLLSAALKPFKTIGMPMGRESSLRMPLVDFDVVKANLPGAVFLNTSDLVQQIRHIKSEAEIAIHREICQIASRSFENNQALFHEGQSLKEAFRKFKIDLLERGADDVPYLVGGAGQGGYGDVISPPTDTPLRAGDVLMLDTGSVKNGYFCDFDRNFAIGHASDDVKNAHRKLVESVQAAARIARPGKTCADLFKAMTDVLGQSDGDVGRMGHGLGIQLTETPSLTSFDQTVLQENMVITLEPGIDLGGGKMMVHEENIVIRDGAPEYLSTPADPDIPVIQ